MLGQQRAAGCPSLGKISVAKVLRERREPVQVNNRARVPYRSKRLATTLYVFIYPPTNSEAEYLF